MAAEPDGASILHVALSADWAAAQRSGAYTISTRGRTLAEEGFVHASTGAQLHGVLSRFYADIDPARLTLLVLDVEALTAAGSPVRWDEVAGEAAPFPHVYGPIPAGAVVAELPIGGTTGAPLPPDLTPFGAQ